jgi:hypothetical protein
VRYEFHILISLCTAPSETPAGTEALLLALAQLVVSHLYLGPSR